MSLKKLIIAAVVSLPLSVSSAYATNSDSNHNSPLVNTDVTVTAQDSTLLLEFFDSLRPEDPTCSPFPECAGR